MSSRSLGVVVRFDTTTHEGILQQEAQESYFRVSVLGNIVGSGDTVLAAKPDLVVFRNGAPVLFTRGLQVGDELVVISIEERTAQTAQTPMAAKPVKRQLVLHALPPPRPEKPPWWEHAIRAGLINRRWKNN